MAQNNELVVDFFIIGCTSEIGSRLLKNLLSLGHKVNGIRFQSKCDLAGVNHQCESVDLFRADFNNLALKFNVKKLILVSWYTQHNDFWNSSLNFDWRRMYTQLCQAYMNIGVDDIVGIGSCAEYSWSLPESISEQTETLPASLYGKEKLSLFHWLSERTSKLLWIRPFFVYGPNDHPEKLIQSAISKRETNSVVTIQNSQDYVDYVYIEDVALVTSRLISVGATGVFNVGTGQANSPVEVAQTVGCRFEVLQDTSDSFVARHPKYVVADNQRIIEVLGNIEWTSLNSGISNMIASREISKL